MRNAACSFQAEPEEGVSWRRRAPEASVGAAFLFPVLPASYWIGMACAVALIFALVAAMKRMGRGRR